MTRARTECRRRALVFSLSWLEENPMETPMKTPARTPARTRLRRALLRAVVGGGICGARHGAPGPAGAAHRDQGQLPASAVLGLAVFRGHREKLVGRAGSAAGVQHLSGRC